MKTDQTLRPENYPTLSIEAARSGWIVTEKGRPAEVFVRWESVVSYIATRLTTKTYPDNAL